MLFQNKGVLLLLLKGRNDIWNLIHRAEDESSESALNSWEHRVLDSLTLYTHQTTKPKRTKQETRENYSYAIVKSKISNKMKNK